MIQSMIDTGNPAGKTLLPSNSLASGHKSLYSNVAEQQPGDPVAGQSTSCSSDIKTLCEIFPHVDEREIALATETTDSLENAINSILNVPFIN